MRCAGGCVNNVTWHKWMTDHVLASVSGQSDQLGDPLLASAGATSPEPPRLVTLPSGTGRVDRIMTLTATFNDNASEDTSRSRRVCADSNWDSSSIALFPTSKFLTSYLHTARFCITSLLLLVHIYTVIRLRFNLQTWLSEAMFHCEKTIVISEWRGLKYVVK